MDWRAFGGFGVRAVNIPSPSPTIVRTVDVPKPQIELASSRHCVIQEEEDDEDRRERERLATTMKLMGIDPPSCTPASSLGMRLEDRLATSAMPLHRSKSQNSGHSGQSVTSSK